MINNVKNIITQYFNGYNKHDDNAISFIVDLPYYCNQKCICCGSMPICTNKLRNIELKKYNLIIDKIHEYKKDIKKDINIYIGGGEPFLYDNLPIYIDNIREVFQSNILEINTNGTLHKQIKKHSKKIFDTNCKISVSVQGFQKETSYWNNDDKSWKNIIKSLIYLSDIDNSNLVISSIITKNNCLILPKLIEYMYDRFNIKSFYLHRYFQVGRIKHYDNNVVSIEDYIYLIEQINQIKSNKNDISVRLNHSLEEIFARVINLKLISENNILCPVNGAHICTNETGRIFYCGWCVAKPLDLLSGNSIFKSSVSESINAPILNQIKNITDADANWTGCIVSKIMNDLINNKQIQNLNKVNINTVIKSLYNQDPLSELLFDYLTRVNS